MIYIIAYLLLFFVPGIIAAAVFEFVCKQKLSCCRFVLAALVFNLLIAIINFLLLYYVKSVYTFESLAGNFAHLKFASKYGLLSIIVGIILGIILGILCKCPHKKLPTHNLKKRN